MRRYLNGAGQLDVLRELAPELNAVLVLESERPEWDFLMGWRRCCGPRSQPASAVAFSTIRYRNPAVTSPQPGVLVVLELAIISVNTASFVDLSMIGAEAELANPSPSLNLDARSGVVRNSAITSSRDNVGPAASAQRVFALNVATNTPFAVSGKNLPIVGPNTGWEFATQQNNVELTVNCFWRERPLGKYERLQ